MRIVKKYESFKEDKIQTIKDILLELEDEGFNIEYQFDTNFSITHIFIKKSSGEPFYITNNIEDTLRRISFYLEKDIYGFWRSGSSAEQKLYVYSDNRGIRTGGNNMKKNWPVISAMRLLIHQ